MVEGELIKRDGQYEFRQVLFNNDVYPTLMVKECRGLFGVPAQTEDDIPLQFAHGDLSGYPFYQARLIEIDIAVLAASQPQMYQALRDLSSAMQIARQDYEFVFKKAGLPMLMVYARPKRYLMNSTAAMAALTAEGQLDLKANDPIIYSWEWETLGTFIPDGSDGTQLAVFNEGNFQDGVGCTITLDGPFENVTISNDADEGKTLVLEGSLSTGQTLVINTRTKEVVGPGGVNYSHWISPSSKWWYLKPGTNTINYTRESTTGDATIDIEWRDGYVI